MKPNKLEYFNRHLKIADRLEKTAKNKNLPKETRTLAFKTAQRIRAAYLNQEI